MNTSKRGGTVRGVSGEAARMGWTGWKKDLARNREISDPRLRKAYDWAIDWFLGWCEQFGMLPDQKAAREFWVRVVLRKERKSWQKRQWQDAIWWFLDWQEAVGREGRPVPGMTRAMRVRKKVFEVGARRGLAWETRKTYARWCKRFASTCATDKEVMEIKGQVIHQRVRSQQRIGVEKFQHFLPQISARRATASCQGTSR